MPILGLLLLLRARPQDCRRPGPSPRVCQAWGQGPLRGWMGLGLRSSLFAVVPSCSPRRPAVR
eukprot:765946-Pyramimonas_sp.AAC.1